MLRLEYEYLIYLLAIIPFFVVLYVYIIFNKKKLLRKYADVHLLPFLSPDSSKYKSGFKFSLLMIGLILLIIGAANPQIGSKMEEVKREGIEVVIAIDISNSMLAEDIKPNRLERAKQSVMRLINNLKEDKIAIVVFAGQSFLQLPLTTDYSAAKLMVSTISTDLIGLQGTAIGSAIELGMDSFSEKEGISRALIIITDGENHEDDALGMAEKAKSNGIQIHTIGMGSANGGPIPIIDNNGYRRDFLKDREGNVIVSKLDPAMLQQVATTGGGKFVRASTNDPDLASLIKDMDNLEKTEFETKVFTEFEDRFQIFIGLGVLFLIIEIFISEKKNVFITRLSNFAEGKK